MIEEANVWEEMEAAMTNVAEVELGFEERKGYKHKGNGDNYKNIQNVIRTKIRSAKNE